jgi:hypothetical protein
MKKIIGLSLLLLSGLMFVPTVNAQYQDRVYRQDGYNRQQRDRRYNRDYDRQVYVVNEYRYVRIGRRVYRETYRSTYTRRGRLVNRVLVNRERMSRYDRYDGRDFQREGLRFNIFLRF